MIKFMAYKWLYFLVSAAVLLPGIYSLVRWQFRPSIDFTGGALIEIKNEKIKTKEDIEKVKNIFLKENIEVGSIQSSAENSYLIRSKSVTLEQKDKAEKEMEKEFGKTEEKRFETVGPTLGEEMLNKTILAAILAAIAILAYVAYAFRNVKYGAAAVLALIHDLLVVSGIFSLLGHFKGVEIDTLFVTAILTTMSFSVHDTIVVFDRIRESIKRAPNLPLEQLADKAVNETMVRSLNNSLTIAFMLVALLLLGGETIKWFILALLIGTISGTYSSPFVATPILVVWKKISPALKGQPFRG